MNQFTRRIGGFGVHPRVVDGVSPCCMFNKITSTNRTPQRLSSDNNPLFRLHQWQANQLILDVDEIKSVSYSQTSHPFIERLIGTIRREYLDRLFFWNTPDLERKLDAFRQYYNQQRVHQSLDGLTPDSVGSDVQNRCAPLNHYSWRSHCNGLYQTPIAA